MCRTGNNGLWCVDVDRTGRVVKLQTGNNGVDKVTAMTRNGLDGTTVLNQNTKGTVQRGITGCGALMCVERGITGCGVLMWIERVG